MVVIGHSQGGLLTKMTVDRFRLAVLGGLQRKPLEQLNVSTETRELLEQDDLREAAALRRPA